MIGHNLLLSLLRRRGVFAVDGDRTYPIFDTPRDSVPDEIVVEMDGELKRELWRGFSVTAFEDTELSGLVVESLPYTYYRIDKRPSWECQQRGEGYQNHALVARRVKEGSVDLNEVIPTERTMQYYRGKDREVYMMMASDVLAVLPAHLRN